MKKPVLFILAVVASLSCVAYNTLIGITPVTRNFEQAGGGAAIITSGSGTWSARTSASWITLTATSGNAGEPVGYLVDANNGVEARTGSIYVEGKEHQIIQAGLGAYLNMTSAEFEATGGTGTVKVSAPAGKTWNAKSNVPWITLAQSSGTGAQSIAFTVAAYPEVATRSGTLTIAGNTFTVNQTGRRMVLKEYGATTDFLEETIKIRITALADTAWTVATDAAWILIQSAASGTGGGTVTLRISRNENANARSGTVTVGTETFSVEQMGATNLKLLLGCREKSVVPGGLQSERVAVEATPGLGWSATSSADWIELQSGYASGTGNGSLVYKVAANPTLYPRSGVITVAAGKPGVAAKKIEIMQTAAEAALTMDGYAFEAVAETAQVGVSVPDYVGWSVANAPAWVTVSAYSVTGSATLTIAVQANTSVKPRSCTIRIAERDFGITQKGRGVTVDYEAKVFDTDGKPIDGSTENAVGVTADPDVSWTADVSDYDRTWIVLYEGKEGVGNGTVKYIVAPYVGDGTTRTGTITIGDQVVYISQRPYELSIQPNGMRVEGNSGAGEIQVALDIAGVWNAIATEPWITIVTGYDAGTGSGKVLFHYTDNNTGRERTAKIVIDGEIYTLTQAARENILITAEVSGHGGSVEGGGAYNINSDIELTAVADSGYRFDHWVLPGGGMSTDGTLAVKAQSASTYQAVFVPVAPELKATSLSLKGVNLVWTNVAWATEYRILRGISQDRGAATLLATLPNDGTCAYLDGTGTEDVDYWYWVRAIGVEDDVWSNGILARKTKQTCSLTYTNLRGTTHANPTTYREGSIVSFTAPSARRGYTFLGWVPSQITAEMSGDVTVRAMWLQNNYTVRFDMNDGKSDASEDSYTYGFWRDLNETNIMRNGYEFLGWSIEKNGVDVRYADKESVKNLSEQLNSVVTLYAVWRALIGIEGDNEAIVTGNDSDGYVIKPSGPMKDVVARIPQELDPRKVVLEVGTEVQTVLPNGATIRIVKGAHDITGYLNLPAANAAGRLDLTKAEVKAEIVKEAMDPKKGAKFELRASEPSLTTAPTKPGLTYTLREGTELNTMQDGASKAGDGNAWSPAITVKGGKSGFYTIRVSK